MSATQINMAKARYVAFGLILVCTSGVRAATLPPDPDNAALLYYQAFLLRPEPTVAEMRARDDVLWGAEPNETVRAYIKRFEDALGLVVEATERSSCQWGIPYSQGSSARVPQAVMIRDLTLWMEANARILVADGDHRTAFEQCVTLRRFAAHVDDEALVMYLTSLAVDGDALRTIQHVLGSTAPDSEILAWLQTQFATLAGGSDSPARALAVDLEMLLQSLRTDRDALGWVRERLSAGSDNGGADATEGLTDEDVIAIVREPFDDFLNDALPLIDSDRPYEDTYPKIKEMLAALEDELSGDPIRGSLVSWPSSVLGVHRVQVRHKAHLNAVKTALEIYRIAAESKELPEVFPSSLHRDPYSGDDFEYEITSAGFVLRCRGKDIGASKGALFPWGPDEDTGDTTDVVHEYEFKVVW